MPIRQLAPDVAAKIAAGEVVERPASVVKELIENSIDADSTQIRVDLMQGGLQLIRITDNGSGIPMDELPLALTRHATSKVAQIDDLEHIRSLGFRGEALASIAAVAEVTLVSRKCGEVQGAQIEAQAGVISQPTVAAVPEGTTITVRNLFSSVPARLKFIKSRSTEVSHCHHLLEQYALAYPEIRFSVYSEGRQIFSTPGNGHLSSVLVEVYGLQIADQMVPLQTEEQTSGGEYPLVGGYVSRPTCYKSTRQFISFFVNRRWVMSRMLTSAVEGAYHSLLLSGRHPVAVINIEMDPSLLDVNVHPAKTEIRFLKERRVFAAVLRAVRAALLDGSDMPHWQPVKDDPAVTDQPAVSHPRSDTDEDVLSSVFDADKSSSGAMSSPDEEAAGSVLAQVQENPWMTVTEEEQGGTPLSTARLWQSHIHGPLSSHTRKNPSSSSVSSAYSDTPDYQETLASSSVPSTRFASGGADQAQRMQKEPHLRIDEQTGEVFSSPDSVPDVPFISSSSPVSSPLTQFWQDDTSSASSDFSSEPSAEAVQQVSLPTMGIDDGLSGASSSDSLMIVVDSRQANHFPHLRVVGQVAQSYIVTEGDGGMYLIDQHAAHERILLERMVASLQAREPVSQLLLTPLKLDLSPQELEGVEDHRPSLEHLGFLFDLCDDSSLDVRAVPGILVKHMNARSLHELLIDLTSPDSLGDTETWEERALANVACKAAIKANYFLTVSEMREMLEQLEQTKAPFSCCHGRPTMVHFGPDALARAFERR